MVNEFRTRRSHRRLGFEALEARRLLAASPPFELEAATAEVTAPVVATHAGDNTGRLFIAEQGGRIQVLAEGAAQPATFLDLSSSVLTGGERGLLGLAFHPDYADSGADGEGNFYVYYSARQTTGGDHDSVIAEFQVSADPNLADQNSRRELLRFRQPFSNHNGGDLHFGPDDGLLYISSGDGGSGGDPQNNAQNLGNLLGKILRIDVDGNDGPGGQYGIPADNPFAGQAGTRDEIFAYGLRNPYRFSFDDGPGGGAATTDRLFAGDVGQNAFEEIDLVTSGGNYGWRIREGAHPFNTSDPDPGNLIDPIAEYPNDATVSAVIGGYVYRGDAIPPLQGKYVFADLSGKMFVLEESNGTFTLADLGTPIDPGIDQGIIGLGQDEAGELHVLTFSRVLAIVGPGDPAWQNQANALDVNQDGTVSATGDVLPLINELNHRSIIDASGCLPDPPAGSAPPPFYDTNGDGFLSATADILPVINAINRRGTPEGEGWLPPPALDVNAVDVNAVDVVWADFYLDAAAAGTARRGTPATPDGNAGRERPATPAAGFAGVRAAVSDSSRSIGEFDEAWDESRGAFDDLGDDLADLGSD